MKDDPEIILAVAFFKSEAGAEPVRDWLRSLPADARKAVGEDVQTVQFGWPLGMPLVRKLGNGLWEVRSRVHDGIARVMFTVVGSNMVLLHGFVKKSNKTPLYEMHTAKTRLRKLRDAETQ